MNPYQSPHASTPAPKSVSGLLAIIVSFLVISTFGCAYIFTYWMNLSASMALIRCAGFIAMMGGIHFVGFRMWQRQQKAEAAKGKKKGKGDGSIWSKDVARGLFWLIVFSLLFLVLWFLML